KTAHASFGYCIGINDATITKTAYGFYLWNDKGDNGHDYGSSITDDGKYLGNNDWYVLIGAFSKGYNLASVRVQNWKYSFDSQVPFERVCGYTKPGSTRERAVYYGCYDTGNSWCQTYGAGMKQACKDHVEMGSDSVGC
ncbi:hypothetical protein BGX26_005343, partial [Mortierella sp. AD094]